MISSTYDVAVVGLGGMGSAIVAHLAASGLRVIGFERFEPLHTYGSSHGESRIIREAYYEDRSYVPLVRRAFELWRELETESQTPILRTTGMLYTARADGRSVRGVLESSRQYDISVQTLDPLDVKRRFPMIRPLPDEISLFEPGAGFLVPELAIQAHFKRAVRHGAELHFGLTLRSWERSAQARDLIELTLANGAPLRASRVVLSLGPWAESLPGGWQPPVRAHRVVAAWFAPSSDAFHIGRMPVFSLERAGIPGSLYGVPDYGAGLKAALHDPGEFVAPDRIDRAVQPQDIKAVQAPLEAFMPGAGAAWLRANVCMYAMTPDEAFIIGAHPNDPNVTVVAGFSGHGFKFTSVVGEIVTDLVREGGTRHEIAAFSPQRFGTMSTPG